MKKKYYPSINMLRGFAALMVCIYHFTNYSDIHGDLFAENGLTQKIGGYGTLGVFVFFIIPFTLIKYNFKLNQLHKFLSKRWIRIEIPYLMSIVLIILVTLFFSLKNHTAFHIDIFRLLHHLFYTTPFSDKEWYSPIYWTLAIEMQFYILIAFIYPLFISENKIIKYSILTFFCLSGLLIEDPRFVFHYAPIFSQGILLLLLLKEKINKYIGISLLIFSSIITIYTNGFDIAFVSILTIGCIAFTNIDKKIFNKLGKISYSLYLIHGLIGGNIIYFLGRYLDNFLLKMTLVLAAIACSIAGAYFYWKWIETPSILWSKKIDLSNSVKKRDKNDLYRKIGNNNPS